MDFVYQLFMSCDTGTKWSKKKFRSVIRIHKCAADVELLLISSSLFAKHTQPKTVQYAGR